LKDTDELKIGDTVLPWLSYFSESPNPRTNSPIPPQMSAPKRPHSSGQQMSAPTPKRWRLYAIIGTVVLLLAGLGLVWIVNHSKSVDNAGQEEVSPAKDDQNNEKEDLKEELAYQKKMREAAERQADEERSNSEKYREEAAQANKERDVEKQEAAQAKRERDAAKQETDRANQGRDATKQETDRANQEKDAANQNAKDKADKLKEVETTNSSLEYNEKMRKILEQWKDKDAFKYCNYKGYKTKKETAKKMLSDRFSALNNAEKEKMIKEMDKWSRDNNIKNYKPIH
jgi:cytoskeletal protein RodZ